MRQRTEDLFKLDFRTFIKSPFTYLFFILLLGFVYLGKYLINSKDSELETQKQMIKECEEERKKDKQLLQDIVFQEKLNEKLKSDGR
jgi:hypothetical protein